MKRRLLLLGSALLAASSHAAITVGTTDPLIDFGNAGAVPATVNMTLQEGANSVLLVGAGWEFGEAALSTASFDPSGANVAFTQLASAQSNAGNAANVAIFAYDLGTVGPGDTNISFSFSNGTTAKQNLVTAVQLFGVAVGTNFDNVLSTTAISDSANTLSNSLTSVGSGSFAFSIANHRIPGVLTADTDYTTSGDKKPPNANNQTGYGYEVAASGNLDYTWTSAASTDGMSLATVALAPVPEPSTFALLAGFATLGLVLVRRRNKN